MKRKGLKGRKKKILEDWAWKERKMRWKLEEIAKREMGRGKSVWIGYGRIRIDEKWWRWIEEEEVLVDERGVVREEKQGEELVSREGGGGQVGREGREEGREE